MNTTVAPTDEQRRLAVLRDLGELDSAPEELFDTLVRSLARLTHCPFAAVSLVDADRLWFKARHGVPVPEIPREGAFCSSTIEHDTVFEVSDACTDPRFAHNPLVTGPMQIRFYAGVPLMTDGVCVGTLCLLDQTPRQLRPQERDVLVNSAQVVSGLFESRLHLKQLTRERERMADFARASGDWMWEVDTQWRCTWVSESFEVLTQIPALQCIGQILHDSPLLDAQGEPLAGRTFHQLLSQRAPFVRVTTLRDTPTGQLQVSRSAVPWFDGAGQFAGFRGTARDVSQAIRIQQQLIAQDALLRKLSSQVPGVIFQFQRHADGHASYPYASDATRELWGHEPPSADRPVDPTLPFRLVAAVDQARFTALMETSARELKSWVAEYRVTLDSGPRSGQLRWMETRAAPERLPDGGTLWHGFTADITERKQIELALRESQERMELASEAAGLGIVEMDATTARMKMDRRACTSHGLPAAALEISVMDWLATMAVEDQTRVADEVKLALHSKQTLFVRYLVPVPRGPHATVELLARGVYDGQGQAMGLVGTCRDVSGALVAERLQREKDAAERANRAKSEFLSRVSHELRTPLNGILGFAQLMQLDRVHPLQGDQQRRLDSVLRAGRHLLDLINEVLDLSRIESEDFRPKSEPVNLSLAVQACLNLVQPLADGSGVRLPQTPLPEYWVQADPRALEQVLMNLLSNAIKYNRPHGEVDMRVERRGHTLALSIRDEGLGMSDTQQASLFQPFNRLGAERSRIEGSGLGLVISRDLMRAMGGSLQVRSQMGQGATFTMVLPLSSTPAGAPVASQTAALPAATEPITVERQVLYVEDEPLNVVLMEEIFRQRPQWRLQVAPDGARGYAAALAMRPDLVLIDINLPDMTGLELLHQLRSHDATRTLHCIALSADALPEQIAQARTQGFDDYWTKPIDVPQVLVKLSEALMKLGARGTDAPV
jgi:signal transduction histidine kinase/CheY-like chemotaxis protein